MKKSEILGGNTAHAYDLGRLDAALGEHPVRFTGNPVLRPSYLEGYNAILPKLATCCTIKGEFKNEFPWHKSNGTVDEINAAASK